MRKGRSIEDLTGKQFGFLKVLTFSHIYKHTVWWNCVCVCGVEKKIRGGNLKQKTKSCGCKRLSLLSIKHSTHGLSKTLEYRTWASMKTRCYNKKYHGYKNYGLRGIKVCSQWKDNFENFLEDMGCIPSSLHTLERKNVNGDYEPANCKWATTKEQGNNKRNTIIVFDLPLSIWCETNNVKYKHGYYLYTKGLLNC